MAVTVNFFQFRYVCRIVMSQKFYSIRSHLIILKIKGDIPPYECRQYINQQQPADDDRAITPGIFIKLKAQSVKRKAFLNVIT